MNRAFIFPGQGSQIVGMGKEFYDNFADAKEVFQLVDETLKRSLSNIIFNGSIDELTLTINAQPALMAVSMAIITVLTKQTNKNIEQLCVNMAGHSLGEYTALCASKSIDVETTTRLLDIRSRSMQEACPEGIGAMAACIGIKVEDLEEILKEFQDIGVCQIANDNIIGQIVISGEVRLIDKVIAIVKDLNYKAIKLKVSAPFHSNLMKPAEEKMKIALDAAAINKPLVPIIQNVTAKAVIAPEEIRKNLVSQICGRVRWRETLDEFARLGITEIIEIGAGSVLTGMIKKTNHNFQISNISNITDLEKACESL